MPWDDGADGFRRMQKGLAARQRCIGRGVGGHMHREDTRRTLCDCDRDYDFECCLITTTSAALCFRRAYLVGGSFHPF